MKNLANYITAVRIVIIPFFCAALLKDRLLLAGALLALSGLSDLADGYIARKYNQITELGKWLDPIADKTTLLAVVVCVWIKLSEQNPLITPLFAIMIGKEFIMLVGGLVLKRVRKDIIPSQMWGKVATVVFYVNMCVVVLLMSFTGGGKAANTAITVLIAFAAAIMVYALLRYVIITIQLLQDKSGEELRQYNDKAQQKSDQSSK